MKGSFSQHSYTPNLCLDWVGRILLLLVLGGVSYRHISIDVRDPYKCNSLLNNGSWLDPGPKDSTSVYQNWQPTGCMMHDYDKTDIDQCFEGGQRIVIAGDSTGRQIFQSLLEKMGTTLLRVAKEKMPRPNLHKNMKFRGSTKIDFLWDPYWRNPSTKSLLETFHWNTTSETTHEPIGLFFMRAPGLWLAERSLMSEFAEAINRMSNYTDPQALQQLGGEQHPANLLVVSPTLIPYYLALKPSRLVRLDPERLAWMNDYMNEVSLNKTTPFAWSFEKMLEGKDSQATHNNDGIHMVESVRNTQTNILLNLRCNAKHAAKGYPHNRTCCMAYKKPGVIQLGILFTGIIMIIALAWKWTRIMLSSASSFGPSLNLSWEVVEKVGAALTIIVVLGFCFLADRTHVFQKSHKQFSILEFGIPCLVFLILGAVSIRHINNSLTPPKQDDEDDLFLSRHQTDEWKGWMQVLILIYHYTGASSVTEIYKIIRLLVSAYLFLTGYGNTLSLLERPDFKLKKVMGTVLRLNILTVGLSQMMSTDYLFYYFPALATFWYLVVFTTLAISHQKNDDFHFVCAKFVIAVFITSAFVLIPGVMEVVGDVLKIVFKIEWDIREWRFRLQLDLFIVYIGVFMALLRHRSQNAPSLGENSVQQSARLWSKIGVVCLVLLTCGYAILSGFLPDKYTYNEIHPYISWIPIISFVLLRNSHKVIRSYYSTGFAWVGQVSLETYILQYHVWLAADTKGLLRLGVFNSRFAEAAITTPLFIWISWRTSEATRIVVKQIISVECSDAPGDLQQGEEAYALLPTCGDEAQGSTNDTNEMEFTPMDLSEGSDKTHLVAGRGCTEWLASFYGSLFRDLRWRLAVIVIILWLCNLVADAEKNAPAGLGWSLGSKEE